MVMTYAHAKNHCYRSVYSNDRVETNRRTDGETDGHYRSHLLTRSVIITFFSEEECICLRILTYFSRQQFDNVVNSELL